MVNIFSKCVYFAKNSYMKVTNKVNHLLLFDEERQAKEAAALGVGTSLVASSSFVFASSGSSEIGTFIKKFLDAFKDLRKNLVLFSTGLAALALVIAGITFMVSKDDKKVGLAKDWIKRIFIVYIFILAVTALVSIAGKFGESLVDNGDKMSTGDSWK